MAFWQTSRRQIRLDRTLVMGIINVTPDSFSDGGAFDSREAAIRHAETLVVKGADILDIGGESTRPGSVKIPEEEEKHRVLGVVEAIANRFDVPVSIDTTTAAVAKAAIDAGAEIINDISGLRFKSSIADVAAASSAGLVLMHSRGEFESLHTQPPAEEIIGEVINGLRKSITVAHSAGVHSKQIVLDIGLGFGKTFQQNLELLTKLDTIVNEFREYPILVGASRKSFIGKILNGVPPEDRLGGSVAAAILAANGGARIIRVHDVKETVSALAVAELIWSGQ
jgi:dihydropteroate synthase